MRFWALAASLAALGYSQIGQAANVVSDRSRLWPTSTIEFVVCDEAGTARLGSEICKPQGTWLYRLFHPSADGPQLSETEAETIRDAVVRWNDQFGDNIRLREVGGEPEGPFIVFRSARRADLCSTRHIGYSAREGRNYISIGRRCNQRLSPEGTTSGSVLHEIMHAVGVYHEQQRFDRIAMISLDRRGEALRENAAQWRRMCTPALEDCGPGRGRSIAVGPYDFGSIMHYTAGPDAGPYAGVYITKAGWEHLYGQGLRADDIGQREDFSETDIRGIEALYPARHAMAGLEAQPDSSDTGRAVASMDN